jgi:aspartokinase-like uncharacterized kinase
VAASQTTVIKLGGSLLHRPDLFDRLRRLLDQLADQRFLIVPGGGAAANVIRDLDRRVQLSAHDAHWQAIAAMTGNAELLCRLNRAWTVVRDQESATTAWERGQVPVLDAGSYLRASRPAPGADNAGRTPALPESWSVTSDSIAAFVAITWPADRLLLVKSCECGIPSVEQAANSGRIDSHFPGLLQASSTLEVVWVNLLSEDWRLQQLSRSPAG